MFSWTFHGDCLNNYMVYGLGWYKFMIVTVVNLEFRKRKINCDSSYNLDMWSYLLSAYYS